jgi:hypothetical protein
VAGRQRQKGPPFEAMSCKVRETLSQKQNTKKSIWGMIQMVEILPSLHETQDLYSIIAEKKKKTKK